MNNIMRLPIEAQKRLVEKMIGLPSDFHLVVFGENIFALVNLPPDNPDLQDYILECHCPPVDGLRIPIVPVGNVLNRYAKYFNMPKENFKPR